MTSSWLIDDNLDRARVLDMDRRIAPVRRRSFAVIAVALVACGPWLGWWTLAPLLAGAAAMSRGAFLLANVTGALVWGVGVTVVGYRAAEAPVLRHVSLGVAAFFVAWSVAEGVRRWRAARRRTERLPDAG